MARKYLPSGLTKAEKRSPALRRKLSSCIRKVEKSACPKSAKKRGKFDYKKCRYSPVAVCRASIEK
jgi:hypothetical protein